MAEEREPIMVAEAVVAVGETQRAGFEGVPAPGDAAGVEVPGERRAAVERWQVERQVIAAARRATANRIQAVGPRRAGNRAEPSIADRELARETIVDRQ